MEKSTTDQTIKIYQSLIKSGDDQYIAILSDDSVDRQGEIIGHKALTKVQNDPGMIVALLDHENKVMNQVGEWVNKRVQKVGEHNALVSGIKWFLSNPNAKAIKGMLDDGAQIGVSIGAIVKDFVEEKINGVKTKVYTDIELLEASFVGIPANRHAAAMAIAKSLNNKEEIKMSDKVYTQKEFDAELSKRTDDLQKTIDSQKKELEQVNADEAPKEEAVEEEASTEEVKEEEVKEEVEEKPAEEKPAEDSDNEMAEENKKLKEELQEAKKASLMKGDHQTVEGVEAIKQLENGKLPILKRQ